MFIGICLQSLASLKARLKQAEEAEPQSLHKDRDTQLRSYAGRFRRPGESRDVGSNSGRRSVENRMKAGDSLASWRKKDSRVVTPDSVKAHDTIECGDKARKQETSTANVKHQVCQSSEATRSQNMATKAAKSCNYGRMF